MVYVDPAALPPIKIRVSQITSCTTDCPSGTVTLNLDPQNPPLPALAGNADSQYPEVTDPFVINPFVINDGAANPFVINPFVINPFVINPFVINPFVINPFVINPFVINPFVINSTIEEVVDRHDLDGDRRGEQHLLELSAADQHRQRPGLPR